MIETARLAADSIDYIAASKRILRMAYVDAAPGTITALVGRSGAGKTTLLEIMVGQRKSHGGQIRCEGEAVRLRPSSAGRYRIGYLPAQAWLPASRRGSEILALAAGMWGNDGKAVAEETGLHGLMDRALGSLSTGERRLLEVAVVLACGPETLILDEPFSHLDPKEREHLGLILRNRASTGTAVLFADHDPSMTLTVADRLYAIEEGQTRFIPNFKVSLVSEWYGIW